MPGGGPFTATHVSALAARAAELENIGEETQNPHAFMRAARLRSANAKGIPTYPANAPRAELDFVLVSERIEITDFSVPDVRLSDHRPLICDFHVRGEQTP